MRRSESDGLRPLATAVLLAAAVAAVPAESAVLTLRKLRIESDPPGADVVLIGGAVGRTPLTVNEREIYPNDYPDDQAHLYGVVTLRRGGCATHVHRVTLDDIERGLKVVLICEGTPAVASPLPPRADAPFPTAPAGAIPAHSVLERRLRQLQVLQELLDEGLIGAAEEQRLRRRLLENPH